MLLLEEPLHILMEFMKLRGSVRQKYRDALRQHSVTNGNGLRCNGTVLSTCALTCALVQSRRIVTQYSQSVPRTGVYHHPSTVPNSRIKMHRKCDREKLLLQLELGL